MFFIFLFQSRGCHVRGVKLHLREKITAAGIARLYLCVTLFTLQEPGSYQVTGQQVKYNHVSQVKRRLPFQK